MPTYATPTDLARWITGRDDATDADAPSNAARLLRYASGLVRRATAGDVYATDELGLPTAPLIRLAFLEATCTQAEQWSTNGIDPTKGVAQLPRIVMSKGADGRSVTYGDSGGRAALEEMASGTMLGDQAGQILSSAGLRGNRVQASPSGVVRDVEVIGYDPTTGVLDR